MTRPTEPTKIAWVPVGAEPDGAKKTTGHSTSDLDKPTANQFNWFWRKLTDIQNWLFGPVEKNIIIGTDADQSNYSTIALYLDDSPAAGDRLLIRTDQTSSINITIPAGVHISFLKGVKLIFDTAIATSCLELGDDVSIEGELLIDVTNAGGTQAKVILLNGSDCDIGLVQVNKTEAGSTITDVISVAASEVNNKVRGIVTSAGGTITNLLTDSSANNTNLIEISDGTVLGRSLGAKRFYQGIDWQFGTNQPGDIYTRDGSNVIRLAMGTAGSILHNKNGILGYGPASLVDGDLLYLSGDELARRAAGAQGKILTMPAGGLPNWSVHATTNGLMLFYSSNNLNGLAAGNNGELLNMEAGFPVWNPLNIYAGQFVSTNLNELTLISFGADLVRGLAIDDGNIIVVVGDGGKIDYSPKGITFINAGTPSFGATNINAVAHDGSSLFVAGGDAGKAATSPDGNVWTQRTSQMGAENINAVAHNQSDLWGIVGTNGEGAKSADGTTWVSSDPGSVEDMETIAFGNSDWVCAGANGALFESSDALVNWFSKTSQFGSSTIRQVVYNTIIDLWVAVGDGGKISTSSDGSTWIARTSGTAQSLTSISFDPVTGIMFVIGNQNVLYSLDGTNWTDLGITGNVLWLELIYDSSRRVWYICSSTGGVGELLSTKRLPF